MGSALDLVPDREVARPAPEPVTAINKLLHAVPFVAHLAERLGLGDWDEVLSKSPWTNSGPQE